MSELEGRRQRAREAGLDAQVVSAVFPASALVRILDTAIETATRVRITPQITLAALDVMDGWDPAGNLGETLAAAFRAAGFEVEL